MIITIDAKEVARELASKHMERRYGDIKERRTTDEQLTIFEKKMNGSYNYYLEMLRKFAHIQ